MHVSSLSERHLDRAIGTVLLAFANDPGARWFSPSADGYLHNMSGYARAVAAAALAHSSAFMVGDGAGVAFCLGPGVEVDEELIGEILQPGYSESDEANMKELAERSAANRPPGPHWYLPIIGVDPVRQGQGLGAALMAAVCQRFDAEHLPAYLESSNPRNVPLYERFGFEVVDTMQVGSSPPLIAMSRPVR